MVFAYREVVLELLRKSNNYNIIRGRITRI